MAGFNQKVAGIKVTTTASLGGITSSGGTTSTLTIDGNVIGTYSGNIGTGLSQARTTTSRWFWHRRIRARSHSTRLQAIHIRAAPRSMAAN